MSPPRSRAGGRIIANQEFNAANSFESTLSAALGAGDTTINVAETSGTPGTPFYVVIDPGDDSKREIIGVDQGKTGTTLTLSSSAQRGLDGTTDVDHDANAVIGIYPIAAYWTDINDRVDQHAHGGGSDGAQVDHGGLSGLGDDDHTQYFNSTRHDAHDHDALNIDADTVDGIDGATTIQDAIDDVNAVVSADSDRVDTSESTSSTSYTDLATTGPSVTVTTGTTALLLVAAQCQHDSGGGLSSVSYAVSGSSSVSATDNNALLVESSNADDILQAGTHFFVTGLTPGSNTFTLKYRVAGGGGNASFRRREITVVPIGD